MADPVAGDVWIAQNPNVTADGLDGYLYKVESIVTRDGVDYARLHRIGANAVGAYKYVRASYMNSSPYWTLQPDPIP